MARHDKTEVTEFRSRQSEEGIFTHLWKEFLTLNLSGPWAGSVSLQGISQNEDMDKNQLIDLDL